jgi:hypothetical protein
MKLFSPPTKKYPVWPRSRHEEVIYMRNQGKLLCLNCRKYVWNKFTKEGFCGKHKTPIEYYEACAYFKPTWNIEI